MIWRMAKPAVFCGLLVASFNAVLETGDQDQQEAIGNAMCSCLLWLVLNKRDMR
jgi:hypothetical protein